MKRITLVALLAAGTAFADGNWLTDLESPVYETSASKQDIIKRAQTCVAQHVRFDSFGDVDKSYGQVLISSEPDSGVLVANSRIRWDGNGLFGIRQAVQSVLTILARDGQFKIKHASIKTAIADGMFDERTRMKSPTAKGAIKSIESLDTKLAECIKNSAAW